MEVVVGFLIFFWCLLCFGMGAVQWTNQRAHKKERDRKLGMMREFPHLAGDILKSIEAQDVRYQQDCDKFQATMSDAFSSVGKGKKKGSNA